jgi:hypothetical protein
MPEADMSFKQPTYCRVEKLAMTCLLVFSSTHSFAMESEPAVLAIPEVGGEVNALVTNTKPLKPGQRVTSKLSSAENPNWYTYTQRNNKQATLPSLFKCNKAPRTAFNTYGYDVTWYASDGTVLANFPFATTQCRGLTFKFKLPTPQAGEYVLSVAAPTPESGLQFTGTPYALQIGYKPVAPAPNPPSTYVYPPGTINASCMESGTETFAPYISSYSLIGQPSWVTEAKPPLTYAGVTMQAGDFGQKLIPVPHVQYSLGNEVKPICRERPSYSGCVQTKPHVVTGWYCFYDLSQCNPSLSGANGCVPK